MVLFGAPCKINDGPYAEKGNGCTRFIPVITFRYLILPILFSVCIILIGVDAAEYLYLSIYILYDTVFVRPSVYNTIPVLTSPLHRSTFLFFETQEPYNGYFNDNIYIYYTCIIDVYIHELQLHYHSIVSAHTNNRESIINTITLNTYYKS